MKDVWKNYGLPDDPDNNKCVMEVYDWMWCYENPKEAAARLDKLEAFVMFIARDYVELSHDKVRIQRDDYIKRAKELLNELQEESE